jgi:hypothetical protein
MNRQMCPKCDVAVAWHLEKCPTCKTKKIEFIFTNSESTEDIESFNRFASKLKGNPTSQENSELTLADVVRAQNRTTHAVRAFVRFLFIQLTSTTLGVFLWNLSNLFIDEQKCGYSGDNCGGNGFLQFVAVITILVGIIWSSNAGWSELSKSDIK